MLVEQWQLEVHNTHPVGHSLVCLQIGKVIRHSLVSSLPKIRLKAQSTRGSINLAIFLRFIRSWTQYCYSLAKIRLFLVTSKDLGENVGRVIKKKIGDSRNGESPIEYCCFDDETKDYLFFDFPMASKCRRTNTLYSFLSL